MSKIFPRFFLPLLAAAFIVACIRIPKQPQTTDPDTTPLTYRFDGGADLTALFTLQASYIAADGRTQTSRSLRCRGRKRSVCPPLSVPVSTSGSGKRPTIPGRTYMLSVFRAESTVPPRMRRFPPPRPEPCRGCRQYRTAAVLASGRGVPGRRFAALRTPQIRQTFRVYIYLRRFLCHGLLPRLELDQCQVDRRPGIPPFGRHPHLGLCP